MMNYSVYLVAPINEPADGPVSISEMFSLASAHGNSNAASFFLFFFFSCLLFAQVKSNPATRLSGNG